MKARHDIINIISWIIAITVVSILLYAMLNNISATSLPIFAVIIVIMMLAAIFDRVYWNNERLEDFRQELGLLMRKLKKNDAKDLIQEAHHLFCSLFDAIYGEKFLGQRRITASIASTSIALAVVTFVAISVIGWEDTVWKGVIDAIAGDIVKGILVAIVLLSINFIADFFSLAETRLILKYASNQRTLKEILILFVIDLVSTTLIFCLAVEITFLALALSSGLPEMSFTIMWDNFMDSQKNVLSFFQPDGLLFFYITTFFTSLFWLIFILVFGLILAFHKFSYLTDFIYEKVLDSETPTTTVAAAFVCMLMFCYIVISSILNIGGNILN